MIEINDFKQISEFFIHFQEDFLARQEEIGKTKLTSIKYQNITDSFISFIIVKKPLIKLNEIDHNTILEFFKYSESVAKKLKNKNNGFEYKTKLIYKAVIKVFFNYIEDFSDNKYTFNLKWKRVEFKRTTKEKKHISENNLNITLKYLDGLYSKIIGVRNFNKLDSKLLKEIKNEEYVYMINFTYKIGLYLGLRASEICSLKISDISKPYKIKTKEILVDVLVHGKGSKERTVPLLYKIIKKELAFFQKRRNNDELIFRQISGSVLTRVNLYNYFNEVGRFCGTHEKGVHSLRHSASYRMSEQNVDIADAQDMLGHSDIATTRIYFKKNPNRLRTVATKML